MILKISGLSMNFDDVSLFSEVSVAVRRGEKIALVGANGSGKTTLLRIIAGELEPSQGDVEFFGKDIGIVKQFRVEEERTLYEEALSVFKEALEAYRKAMKSVERADWDSYDYHLRKAESMDVYSVHKKVRKMLKGVGFSEKDFPRRLSTLSAGEITKVQLAKLLTIEPDLLILDEPGNYLDIYSLVFLKKTLSTLKSTILMATHDRQLMDRLVDYVWDIDFGTIKVYKGDYADFLKQKMNFIKTVRFQEKQLSKEIKHLENVIDRYKKWGREKVTRQAKSKEKKLETLVREREKLHLEVKKIAKVKFSTKRTFENVVLDVKGLKVWAGDKFIGEFTFKLKNGTHAALLGRNGVGKTTLLRALTHHDEHVKFGPNVRLAYVDTVGSKRKNETLLSLAWRLVPNWKDHEVRKYLGRFGFLGDNVFKSENSLSGGEYVRFEIAMALLRKPNFLLMDEPTNHLDVYMIESLQENVKDYEGTLFFSTHDLEFARRVCNEFFVMKDGTLKHFEKYENMIDYIQNEMEDTKESTRAKNVLSYEHRKSLKNRLKSLEGKIEKCEKEFEKLSMEVENVLQEMEENSTNHLKLAKLSERKEALEKEMEDVLERLESLEREKSMLEEEVK